MGSQTQPRHKFNGKIKKKKSRKKPNWIDIGHGARYLMQKNMNTSILFEIFKFIENNLI